MSWLFAVCGELEIQKLWRSVAVDGVDERNIEEYLQRQNIVTMKDRVMTKVRATERFDVELINCHVLFTSAALIVSESRELSTSHEQFKCHDIS